MLSSAASFVAALARKSTFSRSCCSFSRCTKSFAVCVSSAFTYFAEYHTGFPFSAVDSRYVIVDVPDSSRFPSYFSLNLGVEKRFPFYRRQWALRLAVVNLTSHSNPNTVVNSVDAPNFGTFAGGQSRALTFRLRLVGQSQSAVRD